jgi:hypothetical protein
MGCLERKKNRQIIHNPFKSSSRRVPTIHNGWPSSNHILSMSLTPHRPFFAKPLCDFLSRDGKTTVASGIAFGFVNQYQSTVFHATRRFLPVRQSHCGIVLLIVDEACQSVCNHPASLIRLTDEQLSVSGFARWSNLNISSSNDLFCLLRNYLKPCNGCKGAKFTEWARFIELE